MTALERRLFRLEAGASIGSRLPVIFVSFADPESAESSIMTATINGHTWHRDPDEPRQAFLGRVAAAARMKWAGDGLVGFLRQEGFTPIHDCKTG